MERHTLLSLSRSALTLTIIAIVLIVSVVAASTQPTVSARRRNWVPSGNFAPGLGDLWSFKCPNNGTFSLRADTMGDNPDDSSNVDLYFEVVDSKGNFITSGDEDTACTHTPTCGFLCPEVIDIPCGKGVHTIAIGSFPAGASTCRGGGGYMLELDVFTSGGRQLTDKQTALGGGATRKVPKWADGIGNKGPILDNQVVPTLFFFPILDPTTNAADDDDGADASPGRRR